MGVFLYYNLGMFETIVALATPPFKSALAIIRVSGEDSFDIVSKCFSKDLRNVDKRTSFVGQVIQTSFPITGRCFRRLILRPKEKI